MKSTKAISIAALAALALSCSEKDNTPQEVLIPQGEMTFTAILADGNNTKTAVQSDGNSVWWTPGEAINVFYGNLSSGVFYGNNTQAAAQTSFTGTLNAVTGSIEFNADAMSFWAVYPYNAANSCDGSSVTLTVPSLQNGADDTFATGIFPAIAKSNGLNLSFYNLCGGVVFTVESEGITSVTLSSNADEPLAGKVKAVVGVDGIPTPSEVVEAEKSVKLLAPGRKTFTPGKRYYITTLPGSLSQGFTLLLKKGGQEASYVCGEATIINRSKFRVVNKVDAGLEFHDAAPDPVNISFADVNLKNLLVAAFDTDANGELSYEEAAAVTDANALKNAFDGQVAFSSFDEFKYFTGITVIPYEMFKDWAALKSIVIPENVTSFGSYAFKGCTKLASAISIPYGMDEVPYGCFYGCQKLSSVTIPNTVTTIKGEAFYECKSMSAVDIPDCVSSIGPYAFHSCSSIKSILLPSIIKEIATDTFSNCSSLESIIIPEGVTKIGEWAFMSCSALSSVVLPETLLTIKSRAFSGCSTLHTLTLPSKISSIESSAFSSCQGLTEINVLALDVPTIGEGVFSYTGSCPVYVPDASIEAYKADEAWSEYSARITPASQHTSEAYSAWLGKWNCTRGEIQDSWIISIDVPEQSYIITGIEGHGSDSDFAVKAVFDSATGNISISEQMCSSFLYGGVQTEIWLYGLIVYQGTLYYWGEGTLIGTGIINGREATITPAATGFGSFTGMRFYGLQDGNVKYIYNNGQANVSLPLTLTR